MNTFHDAIFLSDVLYYISRASVLIFFEVSHLTSVKNIGNRILRRRSLEPSLAKWKIGHGLLRSLERKTTAVMTAFGLRKPGSAIEYFSDLCDAC